MKQNKILSRTKHALIATIRVTEIKTIKSGKIHTNHFFFAISTITARYATQAVRAYPASHMAWVASDVELPPL